MDRLHYPVSSPQKGFGSINPSSQQTGTQKVQAANYPAQATTMGRTLSNHRPTLREANHNRVYSFSLHKAQFSTQNPWEHPTTPEQATRNLLSSHNLHNLYALNWTLLAPPMKPSAGHPKSLFLGGDQRMEDCPVEEDTVMEAARGILLLLDHRWSCHDR